MSNISYGLRYDQVELDPKKANVDTGGRDDAKKRKPSLCNGS